MSGGRTSTGMPPAMARISASVAPLGPMMEPTISAGMGTSLVATPVLDRPSFCRTMMSAFSMASGGPVITARLYPISFVSWRILTSAPVALQIPMIVSPPRPMSRATNCCGTMTSRRCGRGTAPAAGAAGVWTRSVNQSGTCAPAAASSPSGLAGSAERSFLLARLPLRLRLAAASGLRCRLPLSSFSLSLSFSLFFSFLSFSLSFFRSLSFFFLGGGLAERLSLRSLRRDLERLRLAERLPRRSLSFLSFFSFSSLAGAEAAASVLAASFGSLGAFASLDFASLPSFLPSLAFGSLGSFTFPSLPSLLLCSLASFAFGSFSSFDFPSCSCCSFSCSPSSFFFFHPLGGIVTKFRVLAAPRGSLQPATAPQPSHSIWHPIARASVLPPPEACTQARVPGGPANALRALPAGL
mmetsp:Transcript_87006/g.231221  ORF Transcript_87006/g.231221 Transcript_87006/m.231221 type:complete len:412 (-) Transcript_87006:2-1237(-)